MWSDHGAAPRGRWWKTRSRRRSRSSTGLKIVLAAGVVVAGVIGVSGVYPRVIDAEWVQGAGTIASRVPAPDVNSEGAVVTPGPAAVVPTPRAAAPVPTPLPQAAPLAVAETPDAAANADAPPTPAPTVAAKPAAPVVKRRIVSRAERPRRGSFQFGPFAFGGSPFRM
jgi:S-DNA-T family DNA segregation ATPase FtsK/SpoIIIE